MSDDAGAQTLLSELDPRCLIAEAYRIEELGPEACRSIFLDWALGRSDAEGSHAALRALHAHYAPRFPDHPMTGVLVEGLARPPGAGRRRGGRAGR
ncbi:MAG: hypothetical protein ACQEUZ_12365 [Pseudomonadota bacterium]